MMTTLGRQTVSWLSLCSTHYYSIIIIIVPKLMIYQTVADAYFSYRYNH